MSWLRSFTDTEARVEFYGSLSVLSWQPSGQRFRLPLQSAHGQFNLKRAGVSAAPMKWAGGCRFWFNAVPGIPLAAQPGIWLKEKVWLEDLGAIEVSVISGSE